MQLIHAATVIVCVAMSYDCAIAKAPCDLPEYSTVLSKTRERIVTSFPAKAPTEYFAPKRQYGCVLFKFDIDRKGLPVNVATVYAYPDKVFVGAARYALDKYTFKTPDDEQSSRGAIIFEASLKD